MRTTALRDRVAEATAAAELLGNADGVLRLAVEAMGAACPGGVALAFMRRKDGTLGPGAVYADGGLVWHGERAGSVPWVVDVDRVPVWQRNRWIEPIRAGVHGPAYFTRSHPIAQVIDTRTAPDYGRMMLCRNARMVAWLGVYVDGRRGFSGHSRAALADVLCRLSAPVLLAAQLALPGEARQLAPRQRAILAHVARGATNKQIARDLDISPATVKTTLERLFRASRTANRAALVDWWRSGDAPEHVPVR